MTSSVFCSGFCSVYVRFCLNLLCDWFPWKIKNCLLITAKSFMSHGRLGVIKNFHWDKNAGVDLSSLKPVQGFLELMRYKCVCTQNHPTMQSWMKKCLGTVPDWVLHWSLSLCVSAHLFPVLHSLWLPAVVWATAAKDYLSFKKVMKLIIKISFIILHILKPTGIQLLNRGRAQSSSASLDPVRKVFGNLRFGLHLSRGRSCHSAGTCL